MFILDPGSGFATPFTQGKFRENYTQDCFRNFLVFVAKSWRNHGTWKKQNNLLSLLGLKQVVEFLEDDE